MSLQSEIGGGRAQLPNLKQPMTWKALIVMQELPQFTSYNAVPCNTTPVKKKGNGQFFWKIKSVP